MLTECKQGPMFASLLSRLEKKPACKGRSLETFLTYPMHQVQSNCLIHKSVVSLKRNIHSFIHSFIQSMSFYNKIKMWKNKSEFILQVLVLKDRRNAHSFYPFQIKRNEVCKRFFHNNCGPRKRTKS